MLNFGGPWTLSDVRPFLYRLFANPRVLVGIPSPLRQLLAFTIAQVKGPSSIKSYRAIGGGSPQLKWTTTQAANLRLLLDRHSVRVEIGMRSAEPSIRTALDRLNMWGATHLILLPLFPPFHTGSHRFFNVFIKMSQGSKSRKGFRRIYITIGLLKVVADD